MRTPFERAVISVVFVILGGTTLRAQTTQRETFLERKVQLKKKSSGKFFKTSLPFRLNRAAYVEFETLAPPKQLLGQIKYAIWTPQNEFLYGSVGPDARVLRAGDYYLVVYTLAYQPKPFRIRLMGTPPQIVLEKRIRLDKRIEGIPKRVFPFRLSSAAYLDFQAQFVPARLGKVAYAVWNSDRKVVAQSPDPDRRYARVRKAIPPGEYYLVVSAEKRSAFEFLVSLFAIPCPDRFDLNYRLPDAREVTLPFRAPVILRRRVDRHFRFQVKKPGILSLRFFYTGGNWAQSPSFRLLDEKGKVYQRTDVRTWGPWYVRMKPGKYSLKVQGPNDLSGAMEWILHQPALKKSSELTIVGMGIKQGSRMEEQVGLMAEVLGIREVKPADTGKSLFKDD